MAGKWPRVRRGGGERLFEIMTPNSVHAFTSNVIHIVSQVFDAPISEAWSHPVHRWELQYLGQINSKFCHVIVCVSICTGITEIKISHVSMEVNTTLLPI